MVELKAKIKIETIAWKSTTPVTELELKNGDTLRDVLNRWALLNPDIARVAYNVKEQKPTGVMAIVLNGILEQALNVKMKNGDVIALVPVIDGG